MNQNYPLQVLIVSTLVFVIIILGSLPGVQLSLSDIIDISVLEEIVIPTPVKSKVSQKIEKVRVNRAIDGDTIVLSDGRTIRYLNVDTPETKKPGTPVMCYGKEASEFNKALVEGKEVNIVADKENTDRYGRELRMVYLMGKDTSIADQSVNAQMVLRGFARSKSYKPNITYEKEFATFEFKAQKDKIGVWSCPKPFEE